jgi:hypothetical protein
LEQVGDWGWLRDSLTSGIWQILLRKLSLIWRVCFLQVWLMGWFIALSLQDTSAPMSSFKEGSSRLTSDSCLLMLFFHWLIQKTKNVLRLWRLPNVDF